MQILEINVLTGEQKKRDMTAGEMAAVQAMAAANEAQQKKNAALSRLSAIDQESIRPARAVASALAAGLPVPEFDAGKLAALETEAAALRAELAAMGTA